MTSLFDYGMELEEPSTFAFDVDLYDHWLQDSYYALHRQWREGKECERKEVRVVFGTTAYPDRFSEYLDEEFRHDLLIITDEERSGCVTNFWLYRCDYCRGLEDE